MPACMAIRPRPALLQVLSDLLQAVDERDVSVLALLDLSAAIHRPYGRPYIGLVYDCNVYSHPSYGFDGPALLYVFDRTYQVDNIQALPIYYYLIGLYAEDFRSHPLAYICIIYGIPRASVLGPILSRRLQTGRLHRASRSLSASFRWWQASLWPLLALRNGRPCSSCHICIQMTSWAGCNNSCSCDVRRRGACNSFRPLRSELDQRSFHLHLLSAFSASTSMLLCLYADSRSTDDRGLLCRSSSDS